MIRKDQLFSILMVVGILLLYPNVVRAIPEDSAQQDIRIYQVNESAIPVKSASVSAEIIWRPELLTASAAAVIDIDSGAILFEKNGRSMVFPASTTKLMTAIIAREDYPLDQVVTLTEIPKLEGTSINFRAGEQVTVLDLLRAALIQSSNEAALFLAENHPGGEGEFIKEMNQKVVELQLHNTNFTNAIGFDEIGHYSSARDLALLSRSFMNDPVLREIVATKTTSISDVRGWYRHQIWNTHHLLNPEAGFIGIKTGTTNGAGEVLITEVDRGNHRLLFVVLGSTDRYQETLKLLEWVENSFTWVENISQIE